MPHELAERFVRAWMRFRIQDTTPSILLRALELRAAHGFSYWDSAIVAAALALGAKRLFTEDLSHGQMVEGVEIVDPFR
jgi:predicted nucleic acid-binding protein